MKIIAFTGMPFSGKSEAVKIAKSKNIAVVRMGDMIWDEVKSQGLELNDDNVGRIANYMRKTEGKDIWAQRTVEKIKTMSKEEILIIDGVRNKEEIDFFKKYLGSDFMLVAIVVSDKLRHSRAMSRGREDDSQDLSLIKKRDERELGWGLGQVIEDADVVISNEGSFEEFQSNLRKFFDNL